MKKNRGIVRFWTATAGLALLAVESAWAQQPAPVKPAFSRWMKDDGKEADGVMKPCSSSGRCAPPLNCWPETRSETCW